MIQQQAADSEKTPAMPLDTCVAMTEGSIGYWLQNAMGEVLKEKNIDKDVVSLVTQVIVDENDPSFKNRNEACWTILHRRRSKRPNGIRLSCYL